MCDLFMMICKYFNYWLLILLYEWTNIGLKVRNSVKVVKPVTNLISFQGVRLIINFFSPDQFEVSRVDYRWICIYLTVYIYGNWVVEIYNYIKEKEDAKEKKESDERIATKAKIEEGEKTKEGKYRIWKKWRFNFIITKLPMRLPKFVSMNNGINTSIFLLYL